MAQHSLLKMKNEREKNRREIKNSMTEKLTLKVN